jgi:hypothetical protein
LNSSQALHEVAQYPDTKLYGAASKLKPEDRPTVPVRLYDDPEPIYKQFGYRPNKGAAGLVGGNKDTIYINRKNSAYKDPTSLAAILGHEQEHVRGGDEEAAQLKEHGILKALLGRWKTNPRYEQLDKFVSLFRKK